MRQYRVALLVGPLLLGLLAMLVLEPIPQNPGYHRFADMRGFMGIPNFGDVTSNLGFAVVGALGLMAISGGRIILFARPDDRRPYVVFFVAVALVSLGSAYYHWAPSNDRLLWDRLPMSIAFMALSSAVVADRMNRRAGNGWLLVVLVTLGLTSLFYWNWTESMGRGDLRFYGFVQFYPMLAVPIICVLYREHRYTPAIYIGLIIGWYGLSKLLEYFDAGIFALTGNIVSGHSLKHLAAAIATYMVLRMLHRQYRLAREP